MNLSAVRRLIAVLGLTLSGCVFYRPGPRLAPNPQPVARETIPASLVIRAIGRDSKKFNDMDGGNSAFGNLAYNALADPVKASHLFQNITFWSSRYPATWDYELRFVMIPPEKKQDTSLPAVLSSLTLYIIPSWKTSAVAVDVQLYYRDTLRWSRRYSQPMRGVFWLPLLPFTLYPYVPGGPWWITARVFESISGQVMRDIVNELGTDLERENGNGS